MNSKRIGLLGIITLAVSLVAFYGGWRAGTSLNEKGRYAIASARRGTESSRSAGHSHTTEPSKQLTEVRDFGTARFPELYHALQSASRSTRLGWAKQIEQMKIGPPRAAAICSFYKTLVQIDARTAAEAIAGCTDEVVAAIATSALIGAAPTSAMEQVAKVLIRLPPNLDRPLNFRLNDVIAEWSAVDPVAVARFLENNHNNNAAAYYPELLNNWAMIDPEAAKNWLLRQEPADQSQKAIVSLLDGWFSHDKTAAKEFAIANSEDPRFQQSIQDFGLLIYLDDPNKARYFVERLTVPYAQMAALLNITHSALAESVEEANQSKPSVELVTKWLVVFPPELWTNLGPLTAKWDEEDSTTFANWLEQLPVEKKDPILNEYCLTVGSSRGDQTFSMAMQISDPRMRDDTLRILVNNLGSTREEIEQALGMSHLSSAEQAHLATFIADE